MKQPTLVIMAAGMGSRYGGIKQLDPVGPGGKLIIDYSIFDALRVGFGKVVFVIKRSIESDFVEAIGRRIENQCKVGYVYQEIDLLPAGFRVPGGRGKPWGTGHAVLLCREQVDRPFAVINADDFYGAASFQSVADHLSPAGEGNADYCMIGFSLENTILEGASVSRGICSIDPDGYLSEIRERTHIQRFGEVAKYSEDGGESWTELPLESTVSMNMWGFTPAVFDELGRSFEHFLEQSEDLRRVEFLIPTAVNGWLQAGRTRVKVIPTRERWVGVTYQADRPEVERYIADLGWKGVYPEPLWG